MPPESGERVRRHIYGGKDGQTEVEVDIEYTDGRTATLSLRDDGTLLDAKEFYPDHRTMKQHNVYASDGKTVTQEQDFRQDGTLSQQVDSLPDGSKKTAKYYPGGKVARSLELVSGTNDDTTWYRQDGTLWAKIHAVSGTTVRSEFYGTDGKLFMVKQPEEPNGYTLTVYRPDGTAAYKQLWGPNPTGWWPRNLLNSTDEYAADGTTLARKLVMTSDGKVVEKVRIYDSTGTQTAVRYLNKDGTVEKEEQLDKSGKVVKTEKPVKPVTEPVDPARLTQPTFDDPTNHFWRD